MHPLVDHPARLVFSQNLKRRNLKFFESQLSSTHSAWWKTQGHFNKDQYVSHDQIPPPHSQNQQADATPVVSRLSLSKKKQIVKQLADRPKQQQAQVSGAEQHEIRVPRERPRLQARESIDSIEMQEDSQHKGVMIAKIVIDAEEHDLTQGGGLQAQ